MKKKPNRRGQAPTLDLILFASNKLPRATKKLVEEHLKECSACQDVLQRIKAELSQASTQEDVLKIMWKWLDLRR